MMRREPPVRQPMKTRAGVRPYKVSTISGMGNTSPSEAFPSGNIEVPQEDSQAPADFASSLASEAGDEFAKEGAELKTPLLEHQTRVIEKMKKQPGLVVAHGTGSGKTLSSIGAVVDLNPQKARVLVPASLQENYQKEIDKHVKGSLPVEVGSLQKAVKDGKPPRGDLVIMDEAHKIRNPKSKGNQLLKEVKDGKRMLLTASPVYNLPEDIAPLVNVAAGGKVLREGAEFRKRYVQQPGKSIFTVINPFASTDPKIVRKGELGPVLKKWVDYHGNSEEGFPSLEEERINVPMTRRQSHLHAAAWGQLPLITRLRLKKGLPPGKKDLSSINRFQSQTRQISSSEKKFVEPGVDAGTSPKIQNAVDRLRSAVSDNPRHKAVVYANYLGTLDDYSKQIEQTGIPYASFRGDMKKKERDQNVKDFNAGKIRALLVSGAGGEGLDLKGTRQVQVLEPHWNEERLSQVIGRARRYKSHDHLPPEERKVKVERYAARPLGILGSPKKGVEDILYDTAEQKQRLNKKILDMMAKTGAMQKQGAGDPSEGFSESNRQDWEDRQIRAQVAEPKKPKTRRVDMTDIDVPEPKKPEDKLWNIPLQERMQLLTESERRGVFEEVGPRSASIDKLAARRNPPVGTVDSVQTAPGEFAPGIRGDRGIMSIPKVAPKGKNPEWTAALSMHPADRRGDHHDLRLVDPRGRAHSWAFTDVPEPGKSTYAVQQPTHSKAYALKDKPFTIPQGTYGATRPGAHVEPKFVSPVEVVEAGNDKIRFLRHEGQQTQEFVGRRLTNSLLGSRPMWALHNATKNRNTADGKKIPNYKPKYQEVAPEAIDLADEDAVMMPKIDGAHVLVDLPGDPKKFARVYSYRPTGRDTGLIEHTFKFPDFQKKTQVVGKNTMIRAECWGRGKDGKAIPAEQLGGLLNAGVLKSREKQKELGVQLKLTGIDVVRADGKNMENKPFGEKLQVLDRVRKATRGWIDTPEAAVTPDQKKLMLDGIKKRQNPVTDEGVVLRSLSKADAPVKAKFRPDHDVYVTGVFNKPKGKAKGLAGGLEYSFKPGGPTVGRIGTGFDHATRKDMLENPDRYIGRVAKVQSSRTQARKDKSQLRALRAPSFKEWHIDKTNPKLMEEDHRLLKQATTQAPPRGAIIDTAGHQKALGDLAMQSRAGRAVRGWAGMAGDASNQAAGTTSGGEVQKYLSMLSGRDDNKSEF